MGAVHTVSESIIIHAPIERCWALSTRVELVQQTLGMKLIGGVTTGSVEGGSRVHWKGWKFGLPTEHHTLITRFEPPHHHFMRFDGTEMTKEAFFQDSQESGRFASFRHDHKFIEEKEHGEAFTILRDEVRYQLGFGILGKLAAQLVVGPHIRRLARARFAMIKRLAEGDGWRQWIEGAPTPDSVREHLTSGEVR